jgi:hypothetical protein
MNPYFSMTNAELRDSDDPGAAAELERRKNKRAARSNPGQGVPLLFLQGPNVSAAVFEEVVRYASDVDPDLLGSNPRFVGMVVAGSPSISHSRVRSLPKDLTVTGRLNIGFSDIQSLPSGLKVGGDLDLTGTRIESLPADLYVGGDLYIELTPIKGLPKGAKVNGKIYR